MSGRKYLLDPDPNVGKPRIGIVLHDLKAELKRKVAELGEGFAFCRVLEPLRCDLDIHSVR